MGNPYKSSPFALRLLLLFAVVSAFPILEIYRTSLRRRGELRNQLATQAALEGRLVELKSKYESIVRLRNGIENLEQRLSVFAGGGKNEFQISELIRSAAEIATQKGVVVDYMQTKENVVQSGSEDHHDVDVGLIGQFAPVVQFMHQLLKAQQRVSIVDVDVFGNDPLQQYLDISEDSELPAAKELQQLSSVRVKATLRVMNRL